MRNPRFTWIWRLSSTQGTRLNKTFKDLAVSIFFIPLNSGFDGLENFGDSLEKLRLVRIPLFDDLESFLD
jgi:hypothetical protein